MYYAEANFVKKHNCLFILMDNEGVDYQEQEGDNQEVDSPVQERDIHASVDKYARVKMSTYKVVEEDTQQKGAEADPFETFVEQEVLPLLVLVQTCHLFYPTQLCAESAQKTWTK